MTGKGAIIGFLAYGVVCALYLMLAGGPRGGDMPFGYELFLWPLLMFPIGVVWLFFPAMRWGLGVWANDLFGTYHAIVYLTVAGNFLLWGVGGGAIGAMLRRRKSRRTLGG
jgi:hypothetical protein